MIKKLSILVAAVFMLSLGAVACGEDENGGNNNGGSGGIANGGTGGNDGGSGGTDENNGGSGGTDENNGGSGGTDEGNTGGTGGTEGEEPVDATCDDFCTQATACGQDIAWDDHADCVDECTTTADYTQEVLNCIAEIDCGGEDTEDQYNACFGY